MNDNSQFWKELLGDDYEKLMDTTPKPKGQGKPDEKPAGKPAGKPDGKAAGKPDGGDDDDDRFYQFSPENYGSIDKRPGALTNRRPEQIAPAGPSSPAAGGGEDDFQVDFDFDGEYEDISDQRRPPPEAEKRSGCLGGVLYAVLVIAVCLLLASLLWLAATDVLGLGNEDERIQMTVPEDFTISSIADTLHEKGLIKYKFLFRIYAGFSEAEEKITPGTFELNKNYDYRALVNGMNVRAGKRAEIDVTIPEGYTLKQIFELFDANNVCTEEELWDAAANYDFDYAFLDKSTLGDKHRLEGYLFPDTYSYYVGSSATTAIDRLLSNFKSKFKEEYVTRAETLGYSISDILTIAAMIEKEAGSDEERATIASVIYNRLKSGNFPYLQIDATIYYAIAETGEAFSTSVDSPYNTYNHKGLPAGPIANPGLASIKAALYPESTTYYYYALNKSGTHSFFKSKASFDAFISSDEYGG